MIANLPAPEDYFQSGKELLNFAWDSTSNLLVNFDQADLYGVSQDEISGRYWGAAKRILTTSLAVTQQGVELLLKGRIAAVSPYLLIGDPPSRWPSPYNSSPIDFDDFRTIDAQDLIRVHDTFSATPLSKSFSKDFHSLRQRRNVITHSTGKHITVHVVEVVVAILSMHKALFPTENWPTLRRHFLENAPDSELGGGVFATNRTCQEALIVVEMLKPAQVSTFFGIDKKQRRYICPKCWDAANKDADDFHDRLAVLRPKTPTAVEVYCPVCDQTHQIERRKCERDGCRGNVVEPEWSTCLTCGASQG